ncbi:MAG: C_GCAxxG_C_C family protein [Oscillospiraceae bacterium]|nr:C_GCAxxG_C_C family protein [Oscillospiraceae bacterium]
MSEDKARTKHKNGSNCAVSVFAAYAERMGIPETEAVKTAPKPRSEGGKCGAFLAGKAVLERLRPDAVQEYERRFTEMNGQTECSRLIAAHGKLRKSCNDYVGDAARLVEELVR